MEEEKVEERIDRNNLNLQKFMDDMNLIGEQTKNKDLLKSNFFYGDLSVTNYLLWLLLGEMMMLNNKLDEGAE